jgi:putative membrane protein
MRRVLPAGIAALLMLTSPVFAQSEPPAASGETMMTAAGFVATAGVSNLFEIESSRLAEQRSGDEAVVTFAKQMIADHAKAGEKLAAVVNRSNADLAVPQALDARHLALLEELKKAERPRFDEEYVRMQVQAHQQAVALFTAYAEHGEDAALKAFAAETLPVLRHHFNEIRKIAERTT